MTSARRPWLSLTALASFGLCQLLLLGLFSILLVRHSLRQEDSSRRAVVESYERLDEINRTFQLLQNVEVGERGFVITGNPLFLDPYNRSLGPLGTELDRLAATRVPALRALADSARDKLVHARDVVRLRGEGRLSSVAAAAATHVGKQKMDVARRRFAMVIAHERADLGARTSARRAAQRRTEVVVYVTLAVAQLLSFAIGALLVLYNRRRRRAELLARQHMALLRATLENVGSGVALLDAGGELLERNARLADLFGVAGDEAIARGITVEERAAALARRPIVLRRPGGQNLPLEVQGRPAADDLYVLTYTDLSDRERSDRLKRDFVSTVSHELRTPLTAIRGALGLLSGPLAGQLPPVATTLIATADRNALRLTGLVNDLLDIDKIEAGRMTLTLAPVDLNLLALEAAEANRSYAVQRQVTMAVGCAAQPAIVAGDGPRLHQVITNLISNAAKFSPENGIVTITVEQSPTMAVLAVHDAGSGIPAEFHDRIFGKFAQAGSGDDRRFNGSGLGLNISQAIVRHHGSAIQFRSAPGDTVFSFALPLLTGGTGVAKAETPADTADAACPDSRRLDRGLAVAADRAA